MRCELEKKRSRQCGNAASWLLHSSLIKLVSTFVMFLEIEEWLIWARACLRWSDKT